MSRNKIMRMLPALFIASLIIGYVAFYQKTNWGLQTMYDLNGLVAKVSGRHNQYSQENLYLTTDGSIMTASKQTSTDYEFEQLVMLHDFLQEHDINLLYVNKPVKYVDDREFVNEFGVMTYSNSNADKLLGRLNQAGIETLDLRENIIEQNLDAKSLFYRTDHHWKVTTGLWATNIMAHKLNASFGYHIDESIYRLDNFELMTLQNMWLGESGRKFGRTCVGLDDYTYVFPKEDVPLMFDRGNFENNFMFFIEDLSNDNIQKPYDADTMHYTYRFMGAKNESIEKGKILIVGDSYDNVVIPFLTLGIREVDFCILRYPEENQDTLKNYILKNDFDTVIVSYAQFLIGAHDDVNSDNYHMFEFNQ